MFRLEGIGAGNEECAADGDAVVANARLVVGKVMKRDLSVPLTCFVPTENMHLYLVTGKQDFYSGPF